MTKFPGRNGEYMRVMRELKVLIENIRQGEHAESRKTSTGSFRQDKTRTVETVNIHSTGANASIGNTYTGHTVNNYRCA